MLIFLARVASAVCQRYIDEILTHSLSMNSTMQRLAFDILASIARSGFGHPLSISPTLVALTAAPDAQLSSRAHSMLSLLYQKHASLLSTRFVESAKTSFGYARAVARDSLVHGYADDPPDSHFGRWYKCVRALVGRRLTPAQPPQGQAHAQARLPQGALSHV